MVKKTILLIVLLAVLAVVLAKTVAKDLPFVKKANDVVMVQAEKISSGPLGGYWSRITDYFKRLDKKANRQKAADLPSQPVAVKKPPEQSFSDSKGKGNGKATTKRIWKDEKKNYNWKDEENRYDWRH